MISTQSLVEKKKILLQGKLKNIFPAFHLSINLKLKYD